MILRIKYYGYSCFEIKTYDGVSVITDPFSPLSGFNLPDNLKADIVLSSHDHINHNYLEGIGGNPAIIKGPGERELGWIKIKGIASYHDHLAGEKYGKNTIFCWDMRAVKFCHLGDLGHVPDQDLLEKIGIVDFLFLPIGGLTTLDPLEAERTASLINCKYIVPMHYATKYNNKDFRYTLADFLKGKKNIIQPFPCNEFVLTRDGLQSGKVYLPLEVSCG